MTTQGFQTADPQPIGDLIPGRFSTLPQSGQSSRSGTFQPASSLPESEPISSSEADRERDVIEHLLSIETIRDAAGSPDLTPVAFVEVRAAIESSTRFDAAKAHFWASRVAPEKHRIHKQMLDEKAAEREAECRNQDVAMSQERLRERWNAISGRFSHANLDTMESRGSPDDQRAQQRLWSRLRNISLVELIGAGKNLLAIGPAGGGKTHLLLALVRRSFVHLNGKVIFKNGADFRSEARKAVMDSPAVEADYFRRLVEAPLLVLDDIVPVGGRELTDAQAEMLYRVVNARWVAKRPIWASCNLPLNDTTSRVASAAITAPVWDRLYDNAVMISCNWGSFRGPSESF